MDDLSFIPMLEPHPEEYPTNPTIPRKRSWPVKMALLGAAYDDKKLIDQCPPSDINGATVRGTILFFNVMVAATIFAAGAHYLLNSDFSVGITFGAVFIAIFIGLVDHYSLLRSAIYPEGMKLMVLGGFPVDVPLGSGLASRACKALRLFLTLALGGLEMILIALLLNHAAVDSRIETKYLGQNRTIVDRVVKEFAADRARLTAVYDTQLRLQTALSGQVEKFSASEARNALRAVGRKGSSAALDQSRAGLSDHEAKLAAANQALTTAKNELHQVDAARAGATHEAIEQTPGHIPRDDSFVARTKILFSILHDDPAAAIPAALLDSVVIGLDVAVLTLKGIAIPSTYSMLEARQTLRSMTEQSRAAEAERVTEEEPPNSGGASPVPMPAQRDDTNDGNPPPRRGRGRPRKQAFNGHAPAVSGATGAGSNGHD